MGEVFVIERVSMEMGGKYTCVTADGQRLDAHVTVIGEFGMFVAPFCCSF